MRVKLGQIISCVTGEMGLRIWERAGRCQWNQSHCRVIGKAERNETSGRCRREHWLLSSYRNLELKYCQSKKIPVFKTNLSECQGQEAVGCLCVLFSSQTYQKAYPRLPQSFQLKKKHKALHGSVIQRWCSPLKGTLSAMLNKPEILLWWLISNLDLATDILLWQRSHF